MSAMREEVEVHAVQRIVPGLVSGLIQAGLFSPWDRALFIAVRDSRPFLSPLNWVHPFQGFYQAITQRTISSGLYYILQDEMQHIFIPHFGDTASAQFLVGLTAGALNGALLSPLTVIKYHGWGSGDGRSLFAIAARDIWVKGGYRSFFKGVTVTMTRDSLFGVTYELFRTGIKQRMSIKSLEHGGTRLDNLACDVAGASVATVACSPFNYCRNVLMAIAPGAPQPTARAIITALWTESRSHSHPIRYLEDRLRIGWGSTRVACGMGLGQLVYWEVKTYLEKHPPKTWL